MTPVEQTPGQRKKAAYLPIRIDALRLDSVPPFDLYFRPGPDQPYVLYCEKNTPFTRDARRRLESNRSSQLFIKTEERAEYHRYLASHLRELLSDKKLNLKEKSAILYDSTQAVVEDILEQPYTQEGIGRGKWVVQETVQFMTTKAFLLEHLLRHIACDYYLYTHSVNVVAYSIVLAMHLGYRDQATLREIANGALLHDVGMGHMEEKMLVQEGALSEPQWREMKKHPLLAHEKFKEMGNLGEIALDIILHHHEKLNGTGYPDGLKDAAISPFVRIVAIANVFDALTTDRFHEPARSSFKALGIMKNEMTSEIDQDMVHAFVEVMAGTKPA